MLVFMKTSELAERTKVSVHRLRRYEAQGLISAQRNASGYREFTERTVREKLVSHIAWLKKRKREFVKRGQPQPASPARPPWPTLKKEKP